MSQVKDFEVVKFSGLGLIRYRDARSGIFTVNLYQTPEVNGGFCEKYTLEVPQFRPEYPTSPEFTGESLDYLLELAWPNGLPEDVKDLMSQEKVCVFNGHGYQYEDIGWGVHIHNGGRIPVQKVFNEYLRKYNTVLFAVCNPASQHLDPENRSVIYPLGNLSEEHAFEMVVRPNPGMNGSNGFR